MKKTFSLDMDLLQKLEKESKYKGESAAKVLNAHLREKLFPKKKKENMKTPKECPQCGFDFKKGKIKKESSQGFWQKIFGK